MAEEPREETQDQAPEQVLQHTTQLSGMYESWFLDYASYVILERAVPELLDGLKPVQRRILHAMKDLDDGRFNKVANIIGHTMQYHPHGDASIGDALVQVGQKDLLVDTQGNWGNILTGDSAAASRYIEARLSRFALEIVFNPKTTEWKSSYDGRKREPVALPVKFPLLLAQGVEGIAVGLASKILPHNFIELIDASIAYLRGKKFELFPDFPTGGLADCSRYNQGQRGGKVRVRARIAKLNSKTLVISEIPYGTTTTTLIDSIIAANDKGKIKIKKIEDNTAENVEILIYLATGISPDQTIDALYAFTNCEMAISPNSCVIAESRPAFLSVEDMLIRSTDQTMFLLERELQIQLSELEENWHFGSLEKIFIEKRIYRKIEECETWEEVIKAIETGLKPYQKLFRRDITREDIIRLTEIRIKRISKYDSFKADDVIKAIEDDIEEVNHHLSHLTQYGIDYFLRIRKKYGKGRERRTELRSFETIQAAVVAADTSKLYVNRIEGFAGTSLKKDEYVCDCSDIDDIIIFRADGTFIVKKISEKDFVGKDIIHIGIFRKNDERTIYNMIYQDGKTGPVYMKRFATGGVTRDKEYVLTKGKAGSRILYFSANPNGEAEVVRINLRAKPKLKRLTFDMDFSELAIKGRGAAGNILTKHRVRKVSKKEEGVSTLGAIDIWFDDTVKRLNTEERGRKLGSFMGDDRIISFMASGIVRTTGFDTSTHFDDDLLVIEKYDETTEWTAVYHSPSSGYFYVKRFQVEPGGRDADFLPDPGNDKLIHLSSHPAPIAVLKFRKDGGPKNREEEQVELGGFIGLKSVRAKGKRLSTYAIRKVLLEEPELPEQPEVTVVEKVKGPEATQAESESESMSKNRSESKVDKKENESENQNQNVKEQEQGDADQQMSLEF